MKKNLFDISDSKALAKKKWNITKTNKKDVAIIGIGLKFSGSNNPLEYWDLIKKGKDMISSFPSQRHKEMNELIFYCDDSIQKAENFQKASYLDQISHFDHGKYKMTSLEATLMSPEQRLFTQVAHQAIEDAGIPTLDMKGTNTEVYLGHSSHGYKYTDFLQGLKKDYFQMAVSGNIDAMIPSRISYLLDLKGPSLLIDTACSSSLVAIYQAYKGLSEGTCKMALAGGIRLMFYPQEQSGDFKMGIESQDDKTRTFDNSSTGTGVGEGAACVLMKPLDQALADGNPIYAVLKGGSMNQDGKSIGITAPNGRAQKEVLENAWKNTGISPEQICNIEAHGTGTKIGDPIEINSIKEAFKKYTNKKQFCAISSVKTNLGHLDSVAGIAGFIKTCLALKNNKIPKQIHFDYPNDEINFVDSPLYVNTLERDWPNNKKYCGVSSFGLSGTNCHLILEEAPEVIKERKLEDYYILPVSSYNIEGLKKAIKLLRKAIFEDQKIDLYSLGYSLSNKEQRSKRLVFIVKDRDSLLKKMGDYLIIDEYREKQEIYSDENLKSTISEAKSLVIVQYLEGKENDLHQFYETEKIIPTHIPVFPDKPTVCWPGGAELQKKKIHNKTNNINEEMNTEETTLNKDASAKISFNLDKLYQEITNYIKSIFDSDDIDFHQSFFDLGFDSISIIQIQHFIENKYHLKISIEQLYQEFNTVEDLIQFVAQNAPEEEVDTKNEVRNSNSIPSLTNRAKGIIAKEIISKDENGNYPFKNLFDKQLEVINEQLKAINNYTNGTKLVVSDSKKDIKELPKELSKSDSFKTFKKATKKKNKFSSEQEAYINNFIKVFETKTITSKKFTDKNRQVWASNRTASSYTHDWKELAYPIIAEKSKGCHMWDLDGNKYVDFAMGFGVYLLGYNHRFSEEVFLKHAKTHNFLGPISTDAEEAANLIHEITKVERVAFYNSGTEAVMVALRLARGATNRKKVVVFAGSYHGTFDGINVNQASDYSAIPLAPGTLPGMVQDILVLNYGTRESIELIKAYKDEIAAVLVEPVQSRRVDFQPKSYLQEIREITKKENIALIFDEVITGFRITLGGAQEHFGIEADIVTYGKILGGGLPIGVVAGKSDYLDLIDGGSWNYGDDSYPSGKRVIVGGTFCHHPLTMKMVTKTLTYLKEQGNSLQYKLNRKTDVLVNELNNFFKTYDLPLKANNFGSMFNIKPKSDLMLLELLKYHLLYNNVFVWEGATCFISEAHSDKDIRFLIDGVKKSIYQIMDGGFIGKKSASKLEKDREKNLKKEYIIPLTIEQKRIFAKVEMNPVEANAFNETVVIEVNNKLNKEALQAALNLIGSRHEALRINSIEEHGQNINPLLQLPIKYTDVTKKKMTEEFVANWPSKNIAVPFNFNNGPFVKCYVLKKGENAFIVQLVAHHIVVDGWSLNILIKELKEVYNNYNLNLNTSLVPATQYSDYVNWIDNQVNGSIAPKTLEFWKEEFSIEVPKFEVPMINTETIEGNNSGVIHFNLDIDLVKDIKQWNATHKVSLFSTLLSAYKLMLCALNGNQSSRIGIPYAGQLNSRLYDTVGQCVQMIPFISSLNIELTPIEYVRTIMQKNMNILKYPVIPINSLMENKDTRKSCLYEDQVVFNLDKSISNNKQTGEEDIAPLAKSNKYDLFFDALDRGSDIGFSVEYNYEKYPTFRIQEWISLYKNILKCFVENETVSLKKIVTEIIVD